MWSARCVRNGVFASNTWLCTGPSPTGCVVVDPGLDGDALQAALAERDLRPVAVVCTHGHFDHVGGAGALQRRYDVPVYLHRADERTAGSSNFLMMAFKVPGRVTLPRFEWVEAGAALSLEGEPLQWLHAPGHTPGSSVLRLGDLAFTGDTLYRDGVGLVSLPGEDEAVLRRTLLGLWASLPEDVRVCPGHGGAATLGEIKRENAPLRRFLGLEAGP